jgi:hypothetical protein
MGCILNKTAHIMTQKEQRLLVLLNEFLEKTDFEAIHNGDCIEVKEKVLVEKPTSQVPLFLEEGD